MPTDGCNAISDEGACFTYFTSTRINWEDARQECLSRGYDLATATSSEENTLMHNTQTSSLYCWIGLNDIDTEGTFVWADGSDSLYRNWYSGEPNQAGNEDCVHTHKDGWNDYPCRATHTCYICSASGKHLFYY